MVIEIVSHGRSWNNVWVGVHCVDTRSGGVVGELLDFGVPISVVCVQGTPGFS